MCQKSFEEYEDFRWHLFFCLLCGKASAKAFLIVSKCLGTPQSLIELNKFIYAVVVHLSAKNIILPYLMCLRPWTWAKRLTSRGLVFCVIGNSLINLMS